MARRLDGGISFHICFFCKRRVLDILGTESNRYPSLTGYAGSPVINITIMLLIVIGGIGFLTWDDIFGKQVAVSSLPNAEQGDSRHDRSFDFFLPAVFFFFSDFSALPAENRLLASLFSVRHAEDSGLQHGKSIRDVRCVAGRDDPFELIGGSPGSTAGGMKTTTLAVLIANATATFRQRDSAQVFRTQSRLQRRQDRRDHSDDVSGAVLWRCGLYQRIRESSAVCLPV
mgnify:CR=1 FL=1